MSTLHDQLKDAFASAAGEVPADVSARIRHRDYAPVTHGRGRPAAVAVLGVLGLGVAGLAVSAQHDSARPQPRLSLTAEVASAVARASGDVFHSSVSQHGLLATQVWRSQSTGRVRVRSYVPATAVLGMDQSFVIDGPDRVKTTEILYPSREYFIKQEPYTPVMPGTGIGAAGAATVGLTSAAQVRRLLDSGSWAKGRSAPVHGRPSYTLTRTDASTGVTAVITVAKATNLPERVSVTGAGLDETAVIGWLRPTAGNEALTYQAPPAGFKRVPAPHLH